MKSESQQSGAKPGKLQKAKPRIKSKPRLQQRKNQFLREIVEHEKKNKHENFSNALTPPAFDREL